MSKLFSIVPDVVNPCFMYSKGHLLILLGVLLASILMLVFMKGKNKTFEKITAIVILTTILACFGWELFGGYLDPIKEGLSIYHCSFASLFMGIGYLIDNKPLLKWSGSLAIFGGIFGLLFAGNGYFAFTFPHIYPLSFTLTHILLILNGLYILFIRDDIHITKRDYENNLFIIVVYNIIVFTINTLIGGGANYSFTNISPIAILEWFPSTWVLIGNTLLFCTYYTILHFIMKWKNKK